jgi:hypothetical protein
MHKEATGGGSNCPGLTPESDLRSTTASCQQKTSSFRIVWQNLPLKLEDERRRSQFRRGHRFDAEVRPLNASFGLR